MLESIVKEAPDVVEVHVQLATAYNRLKRKEDAERERAIVDRLNAGQSRRRSRRAEPVTAGSRCRLPLLCLARRVVVQRLRQATPAKPPAAPAKPRPSPPTPPSRGIRQAARRRRPRRGRRERWEEAIGLYAKAVKLKPDYVEGYWYQGTAYYTLDNFPQLPRRVPQGACALAPKNGAAYRLPRPLRVRAQGIRPLAAAPAAVAHPRRRRHAGSRRRRPVPRRRPDDAGSEQYEQALETLGEFAGEGNDNPRVIEAMGIATLRMPLLPIEAPPDRREMILMAGPRQLHDGDPQHRGRGTAFDALAARYPETPNVHYAYGVFLLQEKADKAIEEFKRELDLQPGHPWSLMQIAFEYLKQGDAATALPWAQQAVAAAPNAFPARKALGPGAARHRRRRRRDPASCRSGSSWRPTARACTSRSRARISAPAALEDAAREREEFTRLDRLARTQRSGAQSVGGHIEK